MSATCRSRSELTVPGGRTIKRRADQGRAPLSFDLELHRARKLQMPMLGRILAGALVSMFCASAQARDFSSAPERVTFPSADGQTHLVGYLYKPAGASRAPAVVMMHGRAGAYSSLAKGVYNASTLSLRHKAWGEEWAKAGYVAILVDGFGPRGYPQGFPAHSYDNRPEVLNEVTVRPLDAYGALAYLRGRPDVAADRIGLMGWSNGGSATIAAMDTDASARPKDGFRAALVFYPACGLKGQFDDHAFRPASPTLVFHGTADEEVSYKRCVALVERSRAAGGAIDIKVYPGATHSFDSPGRKRQGVDANAAATDDAVQRALAFFAKNLGGARRN
jgi:carboxymethylenebutenolidase